jgi:hypothetical protein
MPSLRLVYTDSNIPASSLVQCLREEGLDVTYEVQEEARGAEQVMEAVALYVTLKATDKATEAILAAAIERAKAKWRRMFGPDAPVEKDE